MFNLEITYSINFDELVQSELKKHNIEIGDRRTYFKIKGNDQFEMVRLQVEKLPTKIKSLLATDWEMLDWN